MIRDQEYLLEPGYGFLIPPEELVFYQADPQDPWTYVWVGFSGALAEGTMQSMGLSIQSPVFKSKQGQELYGAVKDMMEHNTYGFSNDLRRNGQLQIFLSIIAEGLPMEKEARPMLRTTMSGGRFSLYREIIVIPLRLRMWQIMSALTEAIYTLFSGTARECRPSSF